MVVDESLVAPAGVSAATQPIRLTVAVPTYNRARFIEETVASIAASDARSSAAVRILVIDDGSEDETGEIVARLREQFPACLIDYHYQENSGEAVAVNLAWSLADSDYFAVVSSDDPVLPDWAETMVAYLDSHPDVIVAYPDWYLIGPESERRHVNRCLDYAPARLIAWASCLPGPGTVIRRSALRDMERLRDPRYRFVTDYGAWLDLSLRGQFGHVAETLACWRQHAEAATVAADPLEFGGELIALMRAYFDRTDLPPDIADMRRLALSRVYYLAAVVARPRYPAAFVKLLAMSFAFSLRNPPDLPREMRRVGPLRILRAAAGRTKRALFGRTGSANK